MGKVLAPLFIPTTNRASEESRVESKQGSQSNIVF